MKSFSAFQVAVRIEVPGTTGTSLCEGQFAECDGLEVNLDVGAAGCGTLTLRRGMTAGSFDLWDWLDAQPEAAPRPSCESRASATIVLKTGAHQASARLLLKRCRLTKLKAPVPQAKNEIAHIEELQLRYESLAIEVASGV